MPEYEFFADELRPRDFSARVTRRTRSRSATARRDRRSVGRRAAILAAAVAVPAMATPNWSASESTSIVAPAASPAPVEPAAAFVFAPMEEQAAIAAAPAGSALAVTSEAATPMLARGTSQDRFRAGQCLAMAAYYEAASEGEGGMRAVAQVVLNRVAHPAWPNTVCGVVFQGSERSTGCQFTFTCDGSMVRGPSAAGWKTARRVADAALAGSVDARVGMATHYHTKDVSPYWAPTLNPVGAIGAHLFYTWRGAQGRRVAFTARYAGSEPVAAPNRRAFAGLGAVSAMPDMPETAAAGFAPAPPSVEMTRDTGRAPTADPVAQYPLADTAPRSGTVKAEYANSGRWLKQPN